MTRRSAAAIAAVVIAMLATACGAGQQGSTAASSTAASRMAAASTSVPTAPAVVPSAVLVPSSPKAASPSAAVPAPKATSAAPPSRPADAAAAAAAERQWTPEHGVVATGWPAQKCVLATTRDKVIPHFDTPEAAMTFLTEAYNCNDIVALKRVTVDAARQALLGMTTEATDLRLDSCVRNESRGDYECTFTHALPATAKEHDANSDGIGTAWFVVAPAERSGWYMTVLIDCGG